MHHLVGNVKIDIQDTVAPMKCHF